MNQIQNRFRARFYPAEKIPVPLLHPGEMTLLSWSRVIPTIREAPEIFRASLEELAQQARSEPYLVFIPASRTSQRSDQGKVLALLDDRIYLLGKDKGGIQNSCYPIADLNYFDLGMVLLQGWITFRGVNATGRLSYSTVLFNRVNQSLFEPFFLAMRHADSQPGDQALSLERAKFDYLAGEHFKLMNYARASLLAGECVLLSVIQPDIRKKVARIFGRTFYQISTNSHLLILTNREAISIKDQNLIKSRPDLRYGCICSFIPIENVNHITAATQKDDSLLLTIHLPHEDQIELVYSPESINQLQEFIGRFETARTILPQSK